MYKFYRTMTYIVAFFVLIISIPFFIGYGLGYTLKYWSEKAINVLQENRVSKYFIDKTVKMAMKIDVDSYEKE